MIKQMDKKIIKFLPSKIFAYQSIPMMCIGKMLHFCYIKSQPMELQSNYNLLNAAIWKVKLKVRKCGIIPIFSLMCFNISLNYYLKV